MILNIITRCTRIDNLHILNKNIFTKTYNIDVKWNIIFDISVLKEIDADVLHELSKNKKITFHYLKCGDWSLNVTNEVIKDIFTGWIYFLDDDNILHEDFYTEIQSLVKQYPDKLGFIFSQKIDYKDFTNTDIRIASSENVKVRHIDLAQYILDRSLLSNEHLFGTGYLSDGIFIEKLYKEKKEYFHITDKILCYYNYLEKKNRPKLPKILCIGNYKPELKTSLIFSSYTDELDVKYIDDDYDIHSILVDFNPDCILSICDNWYELKYLSNANYDIRKRWINIKPDDINDNTGQIVYDCAMKQILDNDNELLISYFTPIYNTKDKLIKLYNCLVNQTTNNWEWVIVNDSNDGGKTLKIAEELAKNDYRIKLYDFRNKTNGNIGEVKYRAAMLSSGHILAELDHDDYIVPELTYWLQKASEEHKDCGFFYTDCALVNENWESVDYGDSFAFDYGSYRNEVYNGFNLKVIEQTNINPVTIRHIVGVPNHIRAWRRDVYLELGGHNRNLSIVDDYELILRTFLKTKMCRIPKLGYIQFIYDDNYGTNSHRLSSADIQRRVRSISKYYHKKIKDRFDELGLKDWAYDMNHEDPIYSWYGPWLKDEEEQIANMVWYGN
jgi:O-antigen biosynthesis protein